MAKNSVEYNLTASYSGIEMVEGELVDYNNHNVIFKYRKSGSSTKMVRLFPTNKVMALIGSKGGESQLFYQNDHIPIFRSGKKGKEKALVVTGATPLGEHLMESTSDEHKVILVAKSIANISSEEKDDSAPKRGRKAGEEKKEKPAKGNKKEKTEKKPKGKPTAEAW